MALGVGEGVALALLLGSAFFVSGFSGAGFFDAVGAGRSGLRRCGYAIRYMPATSLFDRSIPPTRIARNQVIDFSHRPIWVVRGQDRAGNDFSVGKEAAAA